MANRRETLASIGKILFSFCFAIILFSIFTLRYRDLRIVTIPLHVKASSDFINISNIPSTVKIKMLGKPDLIYSINPDLIYAEVDCSVVKANGISKIPIYLSYDLGIVNPLEIEIVNMMPEVRVYFEERNAN